MIPIARFIMGLGLAAAVSPAVAQAQAAKAVPPSPVPAATDVAAPSPPDRPSVPPVGAPGPTAVADVTLKPPAATNAPSPPPFLGPRDGEKLGAVGFGVALLPSTQLVGTSGALGLKAWLTATVALAPLLLVRYTSPRVGPNTWNFNPEIVCLVAPWKNRWTRFEVGGGVSVAVMRTSFATGVVSESGAPAYEMSTGVNVSLPLQFGVEHFFAPWLSLGLAARMPLVEFNHQSGDKELSVSLSTSNLLAQLFIYAD